MTNYLEKARELAVKSHGEQKYGNEPYEFHLQSVVDTLKRFGFDSNNNMDAPLFIAGWLHDSLEDTTLSKYEIEKEFSSEIADLVWRVTDEEGLNRKERKEKTYLKIRESESAIILKLADRIANVESSLKFNKGLLKMYQKEQAGFSENLKQYSKNPKTLEMWKYLEEKLNND